MFGTIFLFLIVVLLVLGVIFAFSPKKLTENKPSQEELL
jgi:cbb3-type cytochrome oxidase subunit 3